LKGGGWNKKVEKHWARSSTSKLCMLEI